MADKSAMFQEQPIPTADRLILDSVCRAAERELSEERFRALVEQEKDRLRQPQVPVWRRICRRIGSWLCSM